MKRSFDRLSKRGVIILLISLAGFVFELLLKRQSESFLLIVYGLIAALGVALVLWIKGPKI